MMDDRPGRRPLNSVTRLGVALVLALLLHGGLAFWISTWPEPVSDATKTTNRVLPVLLLERVETPPAVAAQPARILEPRPIARSIRRGDEKQPQVAGIEPVAEDLGTTPSSPELAPAPAAISFRRTPTTPEESAPSFLEQVLAAGSRGLHPGASTLERRMDRPDPMAHLFDPSYGQVPVTERDRAGTLLGQLTPTADGGYTYQGSQIHAEIFADGSVLLYDPPHIRARALGVPVERLPELFKDPRAELQRALRERRHELQKLGKAQGIPVNDDVKDVLAMLNLILTANSISGIFDITESAMRAVAEDPYATAKTCLLTETENLRDQLRSQHLARVQRSALDGLHAHLCEVWADQSQSTLERRATIFELWDECDTTSSGQQARTIIVEFVQQQIPETSGDAYGAVELLALNARRTSVALFSPYR
ncbi:MAG: hypothetical protein ABIJ09_16575 [Pseudomonadota bacterium]